MRFPCLNGVLVKNSNAQQQMSHKTRFPRDASIHTVIPRSVVFYCWVVDTMYRLHGSLLSPVARVPLNIDITETCSVSFRGSKVSEIFVQGNLTFRLLHFIPIIYHRLISLTKCHWLESKLHLVHPHIFSELTVIQFKDGCWLTIFPLVCTCSLTNSSRSCLFMCCHIYDISYTNAGFSDKLSAINMVSRRLSFVIFLFCLSHSKSWSWATNTNTFRSCHHENGLTFNSYLVEICS